MKWVHFDDMSWPLHSDLSDLEWKLRYTDCKPSGSSYPLLAAASVLGAYRALVGLDAKKRNKVIKMLRDYAKATS